MCSTNSYSKSHVLKWLNYSFQSSPVAGMSFPQYFTIVQQIVQIF